MADASTTPAQQPNPPVEHGRALLWQEGLAAVALLAVAGWQRASGGIQIELVLLGLLLLPAHLRRWLAWRGLVPPAGWALFLLELGATATVRAQEVPPLALGLGLLCGQLPALSPGSPEEPRAAGGRAWVAVGAALAGLALAQDWQQGASLAGARAALAVPLLLEALLPGVRSARAELRRGASLLAVGAISLVREPPIDLQLAASLVLALVALLGLALRDVPAAQRKRATVRWVLRLYAPPLLLLLVLAVGEIAFRLVPNSYSTLLRPNEAEGAWHAPGRVYVHKGAAFRPQLEPVNVVHWNHDGWHDDDHGLARAPGVVRLLVLGDSYVEGVQVPVDALFQRRLADELKARAGATVEPIGYGWSGWGQRQELVALRDGQPDPRTPPTYPPGLAYDPDLVVVEFLPGNDVRNNLPELNDLAESEFAQVTFARALFVTCMRRGLFFSAMLSDKTDQVLRALQGKRDWLDGEVYHEPPRRVPELWEAAWTATEAQLAEMQRLLQPRGCGLVVVGFTTPVEIEAAVAPRELDGADPLYPHRRMAEICARLQLPYLALPERLAKLGPEERDRLHGKGDQHWTSLGHQRAAEATASFLLGEQTALWERARARAAQR